jgi:hypothetical protein
MAYWGRKREQGGSLREILGTERFGELKDL